MRFEGILTPVITPFAADLSLDFDAWGEVIDGQVDGGAGGIIVGGTTGEFFALSLRERTRQFEFAAERIGGRMPLIAGVNALAAGDCMELARAARDAGADALLVAAPPYGLPDQAELAAHCLAVARAGGLPVMLYNNPGRTGVSMDRPFLDAVSGEEGIVAIKESSGDVARIPMLLREYPRLELSAGAEDQALEFFAWGARSWVCVVANFLPAQAARLHRACAVEGDFAIGRALAGALAPLAAHLERGGQFLQCVKRACEVMNRPGGPVRPPLLPLSAERRREVDAMVEAAAAELDGIIADADGKGAAA